MEKVLCEVKAWASIGLLGKPAPSMFLSAKPVNYLLKICVLMAGPGERKALISVSSDRRQHGEGYSLAEVGMPLFKNYPKYLAPDIVLFSTAFIGFYGKG